MSVKRIIYDKLPKGMKYGADFIKGRLPYSIRLGKEYRKISALLLREEYKSEEEHERYQLERVKETMIYAYETVDYYRQLFDEIGFSPYKMKQLSDIEVIPFLTKDIIEANFDKLISKAVPQKYIGINTTSGTSGHQLRFAFDKRTYYSREWAFIHYLWKRIGYQEGKSRMASFRNDILPDGKLYLYDVRNRRLLIDTYHLTDENCKKILQKLQSEKIEYIHTYPSAIMILCQYILRMGDAEWSYFPKAIIVTSEMLYAGQKEMIERCFHTRVFTFYGHSERAALASWCEKNTLYHIQSEYGLVELIDENGKVITSEDKLGEIVCTGFHNRVMPLIRYKTGDFSSYSTEKECACGRTYRSLNEIAGRWAQDALIGREGNMITDTVLNMHSMIYHHVDKFQFVQNTKGKCDLLIVKGPEYTAEDEQIIMEAINEKIADSIELSIVYVDDIQRTKAGKYKYIMRNFDRDSI